MATSTEWQDRDDALRLRTRTRMDAAAYLEAREGGKGWHPRFANMTRERRGQVLAAVLDMRMKDKEYEPVLKELYARRDGDLDTMAKAERARASDSTPAYARWKYNQLVDSLRQDMKTVLGPYYGSGKYPEYLALKDAMDGRPVMEARRGPWESPQETAIREVLPEGLQGPARIAMRGTRSALATGASALRAVGRAAGLVEEPLYPGGPARESDFLGRFVERQAEMEYADQLADDARYSDWRARGAAEEALKTASREALDFGSQAVALGMGSAVAGPALPFAFGASGTQAAYDDARAKGASPWKALGRGLGYGAADTAIWMVPVPGHRLRPVVTGARGVGSHFLGKATFGDPETRQDWGGGEAARDADDLLRPSYSTVSDWGDWAGRDANVRPVPTSRKVTLHGKTLPEGFGHPYAFAREGAFSPEGVPYSALDPGEINANARETDGGGAVSEAVGDLFALSEREQAEFDRLTKEGMNPRDKRVRMLRAMLAAGERSRADVKALAWAERQNRDIALARETAKAEEGTADNWQDYYVPTYGRGMIGSGAREGVAEDIGKRADWLRGRYEFRRGAGDARGAEGAMDDLKAFRKKAAYLARRYGLHPELAKLEADSTLWSRMAAGQEGQRASVMYPRNLYVETGHYLTEPSPLTRERDYATARKLLAAYDDASASDDFRAWAERYRGRTRNWSVWGMPFEGGDWTGELDGNFAIPVDEGGNALFPAPEWLTRHVRRRKKRSSR